MRKLKLSVVAKMPSWHFCNCDKTTLNLKISSELCKFCAKEKNTYRCTLYDCYLSADRGLVNKCPGCIDNTHNGTATVIEEGLQDTPKIAPQQIAEAAIDGYMKTLNDLLAQGYPRNLAEAAAKKYMLEG